MTRKSIRCAVLLAAGLAAWQPSKAMADDEDTQFSLLSAVRGKLADDEFLAVDTSLRLREPRIGPEQHAIREMIEQGFADNKIRVGSGAAILETRG